MTEFHVQVSTVKTSSKIGRRGWRPRGRINPVPATSLPKADTFTCYDTRRSHDSPAMNISMRGSKVAPMGLAVARPFAKTYQRSGPKADSFGAGKGYLN